MDKVILKNTCNFMGSSKKKINVSEVLLISYHWRRSNFATIIIPINKAITVASDV